MTTLLVDSCILIDYLRDLPQAVDYVESLRRPPLVSVITVAELFAGVRNAQEQDEIEQVLAAFPTIAVSYEIALIGGDFRRDYGKSHSVHLPDALIAATAVRENARLVTRNVRHFPMLDDLVAPY
jgi:hypothetical protein